jgi:hypothetical protein
LPFLPTSLRCPATRCETSGVLEEDFAEVVSVSEVYTMGASLSSIQIYCNCMAEVRTRLGVVRSVLTGSVTMGQQAFNVELIFLQLRKALELIAFGSLAANESKYAAAYPNFGSHWRAKAILDAVEKINSEFFPIPLEPPEAKEGGIRHFDRPADGFLTRDEFVSLYDSCGEILHIRNPFTTKDPTIQIGYHVEQWVARIERLLYWHLVRLIDGDVWVVTVPVQGEVRAWPASPRV